MWEMPMTFLRRSSLVLPTTTSTACLKPYSSSYLIMQTRRSTILGKRGHQESSTPAPSAQVCEQLQTPDNTPTPKRARTTVDFTGDDSNKENIPPFNLTPISVASTPRATRALRRAVTEATLTPPRTRPGMLRVVSVCAS